MDAMTRTAIWKNETQWWATFPSDRIEVWPFFTRKLTLTYFVNFQDAERRVTTELRTMRESVVRRAVTHVLRTSRPGLSRTMSPAALRRLRATLRLQMEADLGSALDRLESVVERRMRFFPGEREGRGFGEWLLERILRSCPDVGEDELVQICRRAHVSGVIQG